MKVLKRGCIPSERVYEAECTHCKSVIEFQEKESTKRAGPGVGSSLVIVCPVCNNKIFKYLDIPEI